MIPVLVILLFGMTGCAGNNRSEINERFNDNARPIGYYSNENHQKNNSGFFADNDGPITEWMDHGLGAENQNLNSQKLSAYPSDLGRLSDQIRKKAATVNNVQDVRSVVYGSSVLISVDLIDKSKASETKKMIRKAVKPYVNGRSITVITDDGTFSRNRNLHNDIREGGAR